MNQDNNAARCIADDCQNQRDPDCGVYCKSCWEWVNDPAATVKISHAEIQAAVDEVGKQRNVEKVSYPTGGPACVVKECGELAASVNPRDDRDRGIVMCRKHYDEACADRALKNAETHTTPVLPDPQPKADQKQSPIVAVRPMVKADEAGLLRPTSIEEAFRLAQYMHKSTMFEARYKSPEMLMIAMQFALELGLKPMTALRQMAVIKGIPAIFGDLPLSMVITGGKLRKHREWWFNMKGEELPSWHPDVYGAGCMVLRRGMDEEPIERFFTLDMARKANLTGGKSFEPWQAYTYRMLQMRARSHALKDKFPDDLNGIAIGEYDHNTTIEAIVNQPELTNAEALAQKLGHNTVNGERVQ